MRRVGFILVAISATALTSYAQELARPTVDLGSRNIGRAAPTPSAEPTAPELPELSQLDEIFKQTSLGKAADQSRLHAEWRRLRNQVANKPDVVAAKEAAEATRTDLEKRRLLSRYYNLYYAYMQALAHEPDVKAGLEQMKTQHLAVLAQPRVRPSPSPSPAQSAQGAETSPTPSPASRPNPEDNSPTPD